MDNPTYSIIVPAYNESARITATLDRVLAFLTATNWIAEVLVVNDGSRDNTAEIIRQYCAKDCRIVLLENPGNRGKGHSVRHGMLKAKGQLLLFSDADLSAPIEEAEKLFAALAQGNDVAIGSRWLDPGLQVRRQPLHRQLFGRAFNLALRVLLGLHFMDTQCGFKAFTRRAAAAIFPLQKIERWGFDPELLYLARRAKLKVKEVPVKWAHREGGQISPLRDGMRMLVDVLKVRWNAICGRYSASAKSTRAGRSGA